MPRYLDLKKVDTHGGSIRVYIKKDKKIKIEQSVKKFLKRKKPLVSKILKLIRNLQKRFTKLEKMF